MIYYPSFSSRLLIGTLYGALISGLSIITLDYLSLLFMSGFQMWRSILLFAFLGFIVGLVGVFDWNPIVRKQLKWSLRGPLIILWFFGVIYSFDPIGFDQELYAYSNGLPHMTLAFFILACAFGFMCDFLCTHFAGDGLRGVYADRARAEKAGLTAYDIAGHPGPTHPGPIEDGSE